RHAVVNQGTLRFAGNQESWLFQIESPVSRPYIDRARVLERQGGQQLEIGIAAAPLAMAVAAIGMKISPRTRIPVGLGIAIVGELRKLLQWRRQLSIQ